MGIVFIVKDIDRAIVSDLLVSMMTNHQDIMDALASQSSVVFINQNSSAAKKLKPIVQLDFISPTVLFLFDDKRQWSDNPYIILDKLEGFVEEMTFIDLVLKNLDKIPRTVPEYDHEKSNESNYQMIEKQKRELEEAERQHAMEKEKAEKEKLQKEKELQERKKQEEGKKEKASRKQRLIESLPDEPTLEDPNCVVIRFRLPDGNTAERRFLNSSKVKDLYAFIETLDYVFENDSSAFDLIEPFPFKSYSEIERSLKECGIGNNTVLQIREL